MAELSLDLNEELALMTSTEQAAVIVLLLGEQQAADIIQYLNPREVQSLGSAMVGVVDLSQDSVNLVLDNFVATIKKQTNLGLGTTDYVENVLKRALGEDKASTVLFVKRSLSPGYAGIDNDPIIDDRWIGAIFPSKRFGMAGISINSNNKMIGRLTSLRYLLIKTSYKKIKYNNSSL